jgi:lysophospholipase L1-like esterase
MRPVQSNAGTYIPGPPRMTRQSSAGGGGSQLFIGQALGNFSSVNAFQTATGQLTNFAPGTTLWITLQMIGSAASTWEVVFACTDGAGYGSAKGFWLVRAGLDSGAQAGELTLISGSGTIVNLPTGSGPLPSYGVISICLMWSAGGLLYYVFNGSAQAGGNPVAETAIDNTCFTVIGGAVGGFNAASTVRVIDVALWNTVASTAQAQAGTYTTGNRFAFPSSVTSPAVVDWNAGRDWNGSAPMSTSLGSSPITFNVDGSPLLYHCDEIRYAMATKYYFDGSINVPTTVGSTPITLRDSYSNVRCLTDSLYVDFEALGNNNLNEDSDNYGVLEANVFVESHDYSSDATVPVIFSANPGAGTGKTVALVEGGQALSGSTPPTTRYGCVIQAVRLPVYLLDGVTSSHSSMLTPTPVQKRLVILGDSIMVGFYVSLFQQQAVVPLLRDDFPTTGTGGVTSHTAGQDSVYNIASTSPLLAQTVAWLAAELNGTIDNWLWIQLGTNDYGSDTCSAAAFGVLYGELLDAIHAASPGTIIYCQTPFQRIAPATEAANAFGNTLGDYRTAIAAAVATRTAFCTLINGAAGNIVPGNMTYMYSDGIHFITAGDQTAKNYIKTTIGY